MVVIDYFHTPVRRMWICIDM